jgi:hypothetical protein
MPAVSKNNIIEMLAIISRGNLLEPSTGKRSSLICGKKKPSTVGPKNIPANISPNTDTNPNLFAISPKIFAKNRRMPRENRKSVISRGFKAMHYFYMFFIKFAKIFLRVIKVILCF